MKEFSIMVAIIGTIGWILLFVINKKDKATHK